MEPNLPATTTGAAAGSAVADPDGLVPPPPPDATFPAEPPAPGLTPDLWAQPVGSAPAPAPVAIPDPWIPRPVDDTSQMPLWSLGGQAGPGPAAPADATAQLATSWGADHGLATSPFPPSAPPYGVGGPQLTAPLPASAPPYGMGGPQLTAPLPAAAPPYVGPSQYPPTAPPYGVAPAPGSDPYGRGAWPPPYVAREGLTGDPRVWAPPNQPPGGGYGYAQPPARPTPPARRSWTNLAAAAVLVVLAFLAGGVIRQVATRSDSFSGARPSTVPSVTAPAGTSSQNGTSSNGSSNGSATTSPSTAASGTTDQGSASTQSANTGGSLSAGVVTVNTILGYERAQGAGTGIVLSASGEILTNNHVIDGATKITVTVIDTGKAYSAHVVGTNPSHDVAVLQLDKASGLQTARLGSSSSVKIGDQVVGVGNAGGTGSLSNSPGRVVALNQTITASDETGNNAETLHNLIETSASLEPGDSGGPLYNSSSQVIGIDSAASATTGRRRVQATTGDSYAIPIDEALGIVKQIEAGQASSEITIGVPPIIGIVASPADLGSGVAVQSVTSGTPAAKAGMKAGDTITRVDETAINTLDDLKTYFNNHKAGDKVVMTWVTSGGSTKKATITLIAGPAD